MATAVDVLLVLCFLLTLVAGARNGFFRELFVLAGLAAGVVLGLRFTTPLLERGPTLLHSSGFAWGVLFAILFIATYFVVSLAGRAFATAWEGKEVPGPSRLLGVALGAIRGLVLVLFLAGVIVLLAPAGSPKLAQSRVLPVLRPGVILGAQLVLPAPARARLLERWSRIPFPGSEAWIDVQSGDSV